MFDAICRKTWVSPLVAFSFIAVGGTGTLMLFDVHLPAIKGIHEWVGLLFVIAGIVHVILNWRTLLNYLKAPAALATLTVVVVLSFVLTMFGGGEGREHRFGPGMGPGGRPPFMEGDNATSENLPQAPRTTTE